jgi:DNA (cytosine-5)-methyltransferase 1
MTIGSLFSGIGLLELGLEWAGLGPTAFQVEQDPFCRRVLARHWPDAVRFDDVRTVGGSTLPAVDLLCGGFPCQDISGANPDGLGLDGARSGLWFEYLRIIEETRPRVVVIENVSRLVRRGLDVVVAGLDGLGFEVEGTRLQARDVGAPHERERLFLVAYLADAVRGDERVEPGWRLGEGRAGPTGPTRSGEGVADGDGDGAGRGAGRGWRGRGQSGPSAVGEGGRTAEPGVGRDAAGCADRLDAARWPAGRGPYQHPWEPPRLVEPRSLPDRSARVKALGNAVVPHCAYVVGCRVRQRLGMGAP